MRYIIFLITLILFSYCNKLQKEPQLEKLASFEVYHTSPSVSHMTFNCYYASGSDYIEKIASSNDSVWWKFSKLDSNLIQIDFSYQDSYSSGYYVYVVHLTGGNKIKQVNIKSAPSEYNVPADSIIYSFSQNSIGKVDSAFDSGDYYFIDYIISDNYTYSGNDITNFDISWVKRSSPIGSPALINERMSISYSSHPFNKFAHNQIPFLGYPYTFLGDVNYSPIFYLLQLNGYKIGSDNSHLISNIYGNNRGYETMINYSFDDERLTQMNFKDRFGDEREFYIKYNYY